MRSSVRLAGAIALGLALPSCASVADPHASASAIAIVDGDQQELITQNASQVRTLFSSLRDSLRVRVTNDAGAPVAGATVTWTAVAGTIAPYTVLTDTLGMAAAQWTWYSAGQGPTAAGTYTARAAIAGATPVVFTGYARLGPRVASLSLAPSTVSVGGGAGEVTVTVHAVDDRRDAALKYMSVQFYNPTATSTVFTSVLASLALTSGTGSDGVWTGKVVIPQGAERGAWTLARFTLGWDCGASNRAELLDADLKRYSLPYQLMVQ